MTQRVQYWNCDCWGWTTESGCNVVRGMVLTVFTIDISCYCWVGFGSDLYWLGRWLCKQNWLSFSHVSVHIHKSACWFSFSGISSGRKYIYFVHMVNLFNPSISNFKSKAFDAEIFKYQPTGTKMDNHQGPSKIIVVKQRIHKYSRTK